MKGLFIYFIYTCLFSLKKNIVYLMLSLRYRSVASAWVLVLNLPSIWQIPTATTYLTTTCQCMTLILRTTSLWSRPGQGWYRWASARRMAELSARWRSSTSTGSTCTIGSWTRFTWRWNDWYVPSYNPNYIITETVSIILMYLGHWNWLNFNRLNSANFNVQGTRVLCWLLQL